MRAKGLDCHSPSRRHRRVRRRPDSLPAPSRPVSPRVPHAQVYSRFNPRHALAVHGLKTLGARSWFEERMDNATHVPPLIECAPANWAHARAAAWRVCASVAPCDDEGVVLDPTLEQLRNMSVPWLPVSVRELCKARRKQTAAAEPAAGK